MSFPPPVIPQNASSVNLGGRLLRGCALLEFPYVQRKEFGHKLTQGFTGPAIEYFQKLAGEANFTQSLRAWNNGFSNFIEYMALCASANGSSAACECDIGVGAFTITSQRLEKVDFIAPFSNENHRMIALESALSNEDGSWIPFIFKAFKWEVWLLIFFALLLYGLGNIVFREFTPIERSILPDTQTSELSESHSERDDLSGISTSTVSGFNHTMRPHKDRLRERRRTSDLETPSDDEFRLASLRTYTRILIVSYLNAYGTFLGFPETGRGTGRHTSVHRMMWSMLGLTSGVFLLLVFGAAVTVHLLENEKHASFRTLEDVRNCLVDPSSVAFPDGGASQELWKNAIEARAKVFNCPKSARPPGYNLPKNISEGLKQLDEKKAKYFFTLEGAILSEWQRRCPKYSVVGDPFFGTAIGFVLPKNSQYREPLSKVTRVLREHDAVISARTIAMRNRCDETTAAEITLKKCYFRWRRRGSD